MKPQNHAKTTKRAAPNHAGVNEVDLGDLLLEIIPGEAVPAHLAAKVPLNPHGEVVSLSHAPISK